MVEVNADGFAESLGKVWLGDYVQDTDILESWYRREPSDGGLSLRWGAHLLADGIEHQGRLEFVEEKHRALLTDPSVSGGELVRECRRAGADWRAARESIEEEVEMLLLRRVLPGRCAVCPGVAGTVSDGRRGARRRS